MKWKSEAPIRDPRGNASIAPPPNIQQYLRPQ